MSILLSILTFAHLFIASYFCTLPFDLADYDWFIELSPPEQEIMLKEIPNWRDARAQAIEIWVEHYGEGIYNSRPFNVFFDKKNDVWLVKGTVVPFIFGRTPFVIMQKSDGKVLAIGY